MKILFLLNVPSFFLSHRLPIAIEAIQRGWQVDVLAGREHNTELQQQSSAALLQHGIPCHQADFSAAGLNPFVELHGLFSVIRQIHKLKPDIVHTASPKGNLYGGIAARLCRVPKLVVAVSGQGFLFTGQRRGMKRLLASIYLQLIRWVYAHPHCTVIVQNKDDWQSLLDAKLVKKSQLVLIPGSGVDLSLYADSRPEQAENIVLLPARMLTDKGVLEFVMAARLLKQSHPDWRFVLVGAADGPNPAAISSEQINEWVGQGIVEWWGHRKDMPAVFRQVAIVCLPSYREGMPKCLLEAAAAAKPVVTTDAIGCREAIIPGKTGLLVPIKDSTALCEALLQLIENSETRQAFGQSGREWALQRYSIDAVVDRVLRIYAD